MCESSPLGLSQTQNRVTGLPQVTEMLCLGSPRSTVTENKKLLNRCSVIDRSTVVCLFIQSHGLVHAKIDQDRKIEVCHVKGHINSLKEQGARLNDVKDKKLQYTYKNSMDNLSLWSLVSCGVDLDDQMLDL